MPWDRAFFGRDEAGRAVTGVRRFFDEFLIACGRPACESIGPTVLVHSHLQILKGKAMRRVVLLEHVSLDGYVAGPNGEMDWVGDDPNAATNLSLRITYEK